jgi:hypothetical protein
VLLREDFELALLPILPIDSARLTLQRSPDGCHTLSQQGLVSLSWLRKTE